MSEESKHTTIVAYIALVISIFAIGFDLFKYLESKEETLAVKVDPISELWTSANFRCIIRGGEHQLEVGTWIE